MERATALLEPSPPFDFDLTAGYATYFLGAYAADSFRDGVFRRLFEIDGKLALVSVRSKGSVESPMLEAEITGEELDGALIAGACRRMDWMLGLGEALGPFHEIASRDASLAPLVRAMRGLRVHHNPSVFEGLVLAFLGQQISAHVARILRTALVEAYGPALEVDGAIYRAFPGPERLAQAGVEGLRALRFGQHKSRYIYDIARAVAFGEVDLERLHGKTDAEAAEALKSIRGVGEWTAQWLLIRALGRPDGFPSGDVALQRSLSLLLKRGERMTASEALEHSMRWSPHRSFVTTYLFAAARSGRLAEVAAGSGQTK